MRLLLMVLSLALATRPAVADPLKIFAAGSLTAAFTEMVKDFPAEPGAVAAPNFGPSGLLREQIERGAAADILASADMEQPRALAHGRSVAMFTRNRLCAMGRASLGLTPDNLLDAMSRPDLRLATSTPRADPAGDYTWAVFARAEALRPGARSILEAKALQLVGGPNTPPLMPGKGAVQGIFMTGRADIMLAYCSGAGAVMRDLPDVSSVTLPPALSVGPEYGLIVLTAHPLAERFALFVLSERGQAILHRHGFDPVGLPTR